MRTIRVSCWVFLVWLLLGSFTCWGQGRWSFQPYAGLALYQFVGDEADGCSLRPGVVAGAEVCYRLTDYMSVSGAVEYVPRGSTLHRLDGYVRQDHLSVPVSLHFHPFGNHIDMTLGVAPTFGMHSVMRVGKQHHDSQDLFDNNDIMVPLGVAYIFNNGLTIGARLSTGRRSMLRRDAVYQGVHYNLTGARMMNNEVSVIIGYRLKL